MLGKQINSVSQADLDALIGVVSEDKTMEFKREMRAKTRDEVVDFLAAVTSLANTSGGDLLIGVDAVDGLASGVPGVSIESVDQEKLRLEQLMATSVEPRLPPVDIRGVLVGDGRTVLVVRVPQSWNAPHRVKTNDKFYRRNSAGRYPLDVSELRSAFVLSETVTERVRAFRKERVDLVAAGKTAMPLKAGPRMVLHLVPFSTFASGEHLDIVALVEKGTVMPLPPSGVGSGNESFVNLDGMGVFSYGAPGEARAYSQALRNGAVEGVQALYSRDSTDTDATPYLVDYFEEGVVKTLGNYLRFNADLKLGYPVFAFVSFTGMQSCCLKYSDDYHAGQLSAPLGRDRVDLPEATLSDSSVDLANALRLSFNTIWNGFGHLGSPHYDSSGNFTRHRR